MMKFRSKIVSAFAIADARIFNRYTPLAVRWNITYRCNSHCSYCSLWSTPTSEKDELSKDHIFAILDEMKIMGTKRISFSGGEPLLRKDIGEIIDYCKELNISPSMNTNGSLIEKRIDDIRKIDLVKLSLDGPKEAHEKIRGKDTFDNVMKAAETLKENNVRFTFATTLTKHNTDVESINFVLKQAEQYDTLAAFQPLKKLYRGKTDMENIYPEESEYKKIINMLLEKKRSGNPHIRNTISNLSHNLDWPAYKRTNCAASKLFCMINPNGDVIPCDRISYKEPVPNLNDMSFRQAFSRMPKPRCSGCGFCGSYELTQLLDFDLSALRPARRII